MTRKCTMCFSNADSGRWIFAISTTIPIIIINQIILILIWDRYFNFDDKKLEGNTVTTYSWLAFKRLNKVLIFNRWWWGLHGHKIWKYFFSFFKFILLWFYFNFLSRIIAVILLFLFWKNIMSYIMNWQVW